MAMAIDRNIALASYDHLKRRGLIWGALERSFATDWANRLRLKYGRLSGNASTLSGGNQQKLVLAKWLGRNPSLLIVDEPTRGIDVATKAEVHRLLESLAAEERVAVLMISSELPEVLRMGNRSLVMRKDESSQSSPTVRFPRNVSWPRRQGRPSSSTTWPPPTQ